jgi:hypothetical protein
MKLLCFPVKGVGGFNLTVSEVFGVMVAMVSGIVSSLSVSFVVLSGCQSFVLGVKILGVVESRFRGVKVLRCACKDTGVFVGEFTLLLDFKTFEAKCLTV